MKYIFAFFILFSLKINALSLTDPGIQWKVIKLPHFDLIYDAKHQDLAEAYAMHLEEINQVLSADFSQAPNKTLIVLNDRTDLTNGYATAIPEPTIVAFPVLAGPLELIYEHGNWPRDLIMHEYTHILSFEPQRGVIRALRSVFGSIITPTMFLPRWWLEGVAVEMETRHTPFGRLRAASQDAALRSYVVDQTLSQVTLAEINESSIPTWPGGARPYLFGSLMWSQMQALRSQKPGVVDELHQRHGGRIPFLLDGPAYDALGMGYDGIFRTMIMDLEQRVNAQIQTLKSLEPSKFLPFQIKELEALQPVISSDQLMMAYLIKDEVAKRSIRIVKRPNLATRFSDSQKIESLGQDLNEGAGSLKTIPGKNQDGPPTGTISRLAWFPVSKKLLFDRVDEFNRFHESSDLWTFDLMTEKSEQITFGLRAREASVSPDEKHAVFVKLDAGRTSLGLWNFETKNWQTLYAPELLSTVSFPTFISPTEIVFGERTKSGLEGLKKISLQTKVVTNILSNFREAKIPQVSSRGLMFLSTQNGVSNLYLATSDLKSARPLTHSLTAMGPSALDQENADLYCTELTAHGQSIRILARDEVERIGQRVLPTVSTLYADRYPTAVANLPAKTESKIDNPGMTPEPYSPASHLLPKYWIPSFSFNSDGAFISASTAQADPVGLHSYSAALAYDSWAKRGLYNIVYNNATTPALISVGAYDYRTYLALTSYELRLQTQKILADWELNSWSTDWSGLLGWTWNEREIVSTKLNQSGPAVGLSYADYSQSGAQISPETGIGFSLINTSYLKDSIHEGFNEVRLSFVKYFSKWLPQRHALMFKIQGRWIEDVVSLPNYESSLSYPLFMNSINSQYLMRGYSSGTFLFKSLVNTNIEYRFPVAYAYHGHSTAPFFVKRIHAAVVADGIQAEGYTYNQSLSATSAFPFDIAPKWKSFWDYGAEIKCDVTLGYHIPLTIYGGAYWPLDTQVGGASPQYALGLLL